MAASIRQQTEQLLEQLPPEGMAELAYFIEFLYFKYQLASPPRTEPESSVPTNLDISLDRPINHHPEFGQAPLSSAGLALDYNNDPILSLIGVVNVEPFAEDVDQLLYGQ
jgi:hypothetical protein